MLNRAAFLAASLLVPGGLFAQATETAMLDAINTARAQAQKCGTAAKAPMPALRLNPALSAVAMTIAQNGGDERTALAAANVLVFSARQLFYAQGSNDPAEIVKYYLTFDPTYCNDLMSAHSEVGIAIYKRCDICAPVYLTLVAEPFVQAKVQEYRARMFAELNRIRQKGINTSLYWDAKCTFGAVAPVKWNDKFGEAAQTHSNDFASNGLDIETQPDPHKGTKGDTPGNRLNAVGCGSNVAENVNFNYGLTPEEAVRGWIGLSQGHCSNLMGSGPVAGFGISHGAKLQAGRIGPFVTYDLGPDAACAAFTKAAPDGSPVPAPTPAPAPAPAPGPASGSGCAADSTSFSVYSDHSWAKFLLPAAAAGQTISIPGGAYNKYAWARCNRVWWDNLKFTCTSGKWELTAGRYDADGLCHGTTPSSPYLQVGDR